MARGGRAGAPGPRSDVSFRLDQKTANFKVALDDRAMQWRFSTEEKQKNELAQNDFCFIKTITIIITMGWGGGGQLLDVLRSYISVALQQKTANFKVAIRSRAMQRSTFTK